MSEMPVIIDNYNTISSDMKNKIFHRFKEGFPDLNLSDFKLVYNKKKSMFSYYPYFFDVYFKNYLIRVETFPLVFIKQDGKAEIFTKNFYDECYSLDLDPGIDKDQLKQILVKNKKLHPNESIPNSNLQIEVRIFCNEIWQSDSGFLKLAYSIIYNDFELIIDAFTGDILHTISDLVP